MPEYSPLAVGDMVTVTDRGLTEFMVINVTEHAARIRQWPLADAPLAEEVMRSQLTKVGEGDE